MARRQSWTPDLGSGLRCGTGCVWHISRGLADEHEREIIGGNNRCGNNRCRRQTTKYPFSGIEKIPKLDSHGGGRARRRNSVFPNRLNIPGDILPLEQSTVSVLRTLIVSDIQYTRAPLLASAMSLRVGPITKIMCLTAGKCGGWMRVNLGRKKRQHRERGAVQAATLSLPPGDNTLLGLVYPVTELMRLSESG